MKQLITITTILAFTFTGLSAQHDKKSKDMLDKLSAKTDSYSSVEVSFTFKMTNKDQGINESQSGTLKMKDEKYYLKIDTKEIFCDAEKVYTYDKELNECQVIDVDELDEDAITPKNIFTIYEQGFKTKMKSEQKDKKGRNIMTIYMYPKKPKEKDYTMVRLDVDKDKLQVTKATILGKNGSYYYYYINSLTPNKSYSESTFKFDKSKYPGVQILD